MFVGAPDRIRARIDPRLAAAIDALGDEAPTKDQVATAQANLRLIRAEVVALPWAPARPPPPPGSPRYHGQPGEGATRESSRAAYAEAIGLLERAGNDVDTLVSGNPKAIAVPALSEAISALRGGVAARRRQDRPPQGGAVPADPPAGPSEDELEMDIALVQQGIDDVTALPDDPAPADLAGISARLGHLLADLEGGEGEHRWHAHHHVTRAKQAVEVMLVGRETALALVRDDLNLLAAAFGKLVAAEEELDRYRRGERRPVPEEPERPAPGPQPT